MASDLYKGDLEMVKEEGQNFTGLTKGEKVQKIAPLLLKWYEEKARSLPWH